MMPDEKSRLLALLAHAGTWCRDAEAKDGHGDPVTYDDGAAVAWDVTGAVCRLFGWQRARVLFVQMERHIRGKRRTVGWRRREPGIDAMKALQDFNDRPDTTFDRLREQLEAMPVWNSGNRLGDARDGT